MGRKAFTLYTLIYTILDVTILSFGTTSWTGLLRGSQYALINFLLFDSIPLLLNGLTKLLMIHGMM